MTTNKREQEDTSVLALLYDVFKQSYPESVESIKREIEGLFEELYGYHLENAEEITAVFVGMGEDRSRVAHAEGIKMGVRLALDLELDSMMMGGAVHVFNC